MGPADPVVTGTRGVSLVSTRHEESLRDQGLTVSRPVGAIL
jgi:hypothetical protein